MPLKNYKSKKSIHSLPKVQKNEENPQQRLPWNKHISFVLDLLNSGMNFVVTESTTLLNKKR